MATFKIRGSSFNVIYPYKDERGEKKQQWETYTTELEAVQRKSYIDFLQAKRQHDKIFEAVLDYKAKKDEEQKLIKAEQNRLAAECNVGIGENDYLNSVGSNKKTLEEFFVRWLPYHVKVNVLTANTYDSYVGNYKQHILPYFGKRIMNSITSEDIDGFLEHLNKKPVKGYKSCNKNPNSVPTLSSATIKKCYNQLMAGFPDAKRWGYIKCIPETTSPVEKYAKRKGWEPEKVFEILEFIDPDDIIHLAVHIAFVCSMRAGEVAGILASKIDFYDRSMQIMYEVQRVSDEAIANIPQSQIHRIFPKVIKDAKSSLILTDPKTTGSIRKTFLTTPLLHEINKRLKQIECNKEFFGTEYQDNGLLICHPDGKPFDPKEFNKMFKKWQTAKQIMAADQIEFQGLRKSGQMHKVRISNNNFQLVAENAGQSPEVLMKNYNETYESEKRTLSLLVESSFYSKSSESNAVDSEDEKLLQIMEQIQNDSALSQKLMRLLANNAVGAIKNT